MVELLFIAQQISGNKAICDKLVNPAKPGQKPTTTAAYSLLVSTINGASNLVMVEKDINKAKALAMGAGGLTVTTSEAASASKKKQFFRVSKKTQVRRLDCSLSHDMTRLSFLTGGSCQLSNSNTDTTFERRTAAFDKCCVEYDWRSAGTIFRGIYPVIYGRL